MPSDVLPSGAAAAEPTGTFPDTGTAPAPANATVPAPAAAAEPAPADTTDASKTGVNDSPTSLLDAVRSVVKNASDDALGLPALKSEGPQDPAGAASEPQAGTQPGSTTEPPSQDSEGDGTAEGQDDGDITPEELAAIQKPSVRKRISRLLEQRNNARGELDTLRPDADAWRSWSNFIRANHVAPESQQALYTIIQDIRSADPARAERALGLMQPWVDMLQSIAGRKLPAEVQAQVDDGHMTEAAARELVRARNAEAAARARAAEIEAERRQSQEADAFQAHAYAVRSAVAAWEADVRTRDPDYAQKEDAIRDRAAALVQQRGMPRSQDEAVAWAREAYEEVTRRMARLRPPPAPTRPSPSSVQTSTQGTPEPNSLMEAALAGLRRTRAA